MSSASTLTNTTTIIFTRHHIARRITGARFSDGMRGQWSIAAASFGHIWASISGGCVHENASKDQKMSFSLSCAVRKISERRSRRSWFDPAGRAKRRPGAELRSAGGLTHAAAKHLTRENCLDTGNMLSLLLAEWRWKCVSRRCLIDTCWFVFL